MRRLHLLVAGAGGPTVGLAVVLALAFGFLQAGSSAPVSNGEAMAAYEVAAAPAGGPQEGIQVHGRWTIEVRQPDGSVVSRREFDNALTTGGSNSLNSFLSRQLTVGSWHVQLLSADPSTTGDSPCLDAAGRAPCIAAESTSPLSAPNVFKTLTVTVPTSGANANKLVLSGNFTAQADGNVREVMTWVWSCANTTAPASCPGSSGALFTDAALATAIPVLTDQQVLVTVVISFS